MADDQIGIEDAPERMLPAAPKGSDDPHSWSEPIKAFEIRSKTYVTDKIKAPSPGSLLKLVDADVFLSSSGKNGEKINNVASRPDSYVTYLREKCKEERRIFVVNFQMHPRYFALTFLEMDREANEKVEAGQLLNSLFAAPSESGWTDAEWSQRLKLIPRIEHFHVPGVNLNRPTLIANKITCQLHRESSLVEIDINLFSSRVAKFILGYVEGACSKLIIELAFTLEGTSAEELPERILGAVRLSKIDLAENKTRKAEG